MRRTAGIAAAAALALLVVAPGAAASKRPSSSQAAAITRAVQTSTVGGVDRVPRNRYVVSHRRISTVEKSWAYAQIQPRKRFQSTFQSAYAMLVNPAGTRTWVVVDLGSAQVGCGVVPTAVISDLLGGDAGCPPEDDPSALTRTAQSAPVSASGSTVVLQAAITTAGQLQVRIAVPGATGETVLAQTTAAIPDAVSDASKAGLQVTLSASGTGTVAVLGPRNATEPDAVRFDVRWSVDGTPSIQITLAGT
jgi:hypothetical protein